MVIVDHLLHGRLDSLSCMVVMHDLCHRPVAALYGVPLQGAVHLRRNASIVNHGLGDRSHWWLRRCRGRLLQVLHEPLQIVAWDPRLHADPREIVLEVLALQYRPLVIFQSVRHRVLDSLEEGVVDSIRRRFLHVDTEEAMLGVFVLDGRIEDLFKCRSSP